MSWVNIFHQMEADIYYIFHNIYYIFHNIYSVYMYIYNVLIFIIIIKLYVIIINYNYCLSVSHSPGVSAFFSV